VEIALFADAKAIHFLNGGEFVSALYTGTSAFSSKVKDPSLIRNYQYDSKLSPYLPHCVLDVPEEFQSRSYLHYRGNE
jgi:hypothetical protein